MLIPEASSPPAVYILTLFGGPHLLRDGFPCPISPQQGAVLGFLYGGEEARQSRESILSTFWPEDEVPIARRRLNQLLYSLRKRMGEPALFRAEGEVLAQVPDIVVTDLQQYSEALEAGRLQEARRHLSKPFLQLSEGLFSTALSEWISQRDYEFKSRLRRLAKLRSAEEEGRGNWAEVQEASEVLLALDPTEESHLRTLLRGLARTEGLQSVKAAVKDFKALQERLLETPWKPGPETEVLLQNIQEGFSSSQPVWSPSSKHQPPEPPLLGRAKEYQRLRRALSTPPHEALRGILIVGEAGIGKTRLIKEALSGMTIGAQTVFRAGTAELERLIPLNPLIEAFATPRAGETLAALEEPWRAVLYGVMPKHFTEPGPIPQAPQIQPGSIPRRLFEAFHQLLLSLTEDGPVLLVIEDIQWADETTLAVLDFLVRRWDQGRLQLLISARSEEIHRNETLRSFLEMLRVHDDFLEIPLGDLSGTTSTELITWVAERPLDEGELRHLHSMAGGNPFFLIELTLEYLAGRVDHPAPGTSPLTIPLSIRQVLQRRLSRLSTEADRMLGALSVFIRPLHYQELARLVEAPTEDCITALDQLHQFRLINSSGLQVSIGHELIRQTVYQGLADSRRAWLHERVARYLERGSKLAPADELAVHFHAAGLKSEARAYARRAADHAEESGAVAEALRFLEIAREHSEDPEEIAELIARMGHLHYLHQNLEEAAPLLEIAAQRFRRQGHTAKALISELERVDALGQSGLLPLRECLEELGQIKEEAKRTEEWGTFTRALDIEIHFRHHAGDLHGVQGVIAEARKHTNQGPSEALCRARAILALDLYFGEPAAGVAAAREAVEIAMETKDRDLQLHALNRLIVVLLYQGALGSKEGQSAQSAAEKRLAQSGDLILKFFTRLNKGVWHLEIGELEEARNAFPVAESVLKTTQARNAHLWLSLNQGELALLMDDIPEARANFEKAENLFGRTSPLLFKSVLTAGLGLCATREGNLSEAKKHEMDLPPIPDHWTYDPSVIALFKAEMMRMRGNLSGAEHFLGQVIDDIEGRFVTSWIKLSIRRVDILKRTKPSKALAFAQEALSVGQRLGLTERVQECERRIRTLKNLK